MGRKNKLAKVWAERIEACEFSSNVKAWCRYNNVSASQYYYWIKKLNNNIEAEVPGNTSVEWSKVARERLRIS